MASPEIERMSSRANWYFLLPSSGYQKYCYHSDNEKTKQVNPIKNQNKKFFYSKEIKDDTIKLSKSYY